MVNFKFKTDDLEKKFSVWPHFLNQNFDTDRDYDVVFESDIPIIYDSDGRKFKIDFVNDHINYNKQKKSIQQEPLAKALGAGKKGLRLLDLSAGLGIDALFLAQLGFQVTAIERNPLVYMALKIASEHLDPSKIKIEFMFDQSKHFVESLMKNVQSDQLENYFDVAYFDPMFPDKRKTALPRQEMVFFKQCVGSDDDALDLVEYLQKNRIFKRFVVKRPSSASVFGKASGAIEGKIIRYDIYGY